MTSRRQPASAGTVGVSRCQLAAHCVNRPPSAAEINPREAEEKAIRSLDPVRAAKLAEARAEREAAKAAALAEQMRLEAPDRMRPMRACASGEPRGR
jgi:hypothetical protein